MMNMLYIYIYILVKHEMTCLTNILQCITIIIMYTEYCNDDLSCRPTRYGYGSNINDSTNCYWSFSSCKQQSFIEDCSYVAQTWSIK